VERRLIARGLLAGAGAGIVAFLFARLFAEPVIGRAIEYENGRADIAELHGVHEHGVELFTRGLQANGGLGFGVLTFGVAMGALFAVVFCVTCGRVGNVEPRLFSVLLATGAFIAVYLVPFVKYPANPPAVGQADTIGARTGWYLVAVLTSALLAIAAMWLARRLANRLGGWNAALLAAGFYLVLIVLVMALLPTVDETPEPMRDASGVIIYPGFPADVLYQFRLLSLGTQVVLWATIGLVFAMLAGRLLGERAKHGRTSSSAA
jgi:predicted cobalt transporter CbtA